MKRILEGVSSHHTHSIKCWDTQKLFLTQPLMDAIWIRFWGKVGKLWLPLIEAEELEDE